MGGYHKAWRECGGFDGFDDVLRGVIYQAGLDPLILILWYFVSYAHFVAVPHAASVCEVEHFAKVYVKIGFAYYASVTIVIFLPKVFAIILACGGAVHANGLYGIEVTEILKPLLKMLICFFRIAVADAHILIVIPYLMPHSCY